MTHQHEGTILCVNHWHDDNKGDSAITEATVRLVAQRWPGHRIRIVGLQSTDAASLSDSCRNIQRLFPAVTCEPALLPTELDCMFGDRERHRGRITRAITFVEAVRWFVRLLPWVAAFLVGRVPAGVSRRLVDADLVVMIGGSNVYDDPDVRQPFSLARLFTVLYPAWAAQRLRIPVVAFGHTLGPFDRSPAASLASRVLARSSTVVLREEVSLTTAAQLRLGNVRVAPDVAFAVDPHRTPTIDAVLRRLPAGPRGSLALVVRQHPHGGVESDRRVLHELADLATAMLQAGEVEHVLVIVQACGPTQIEDDRSISSQLLALLPQGRASLIADDLTAGELAALYGACRLVVTVRLHAAILAMVGGTPAYAISYFTAKTAGVLRGAGLPHAWSTHDGFTAAGVLDQLDVLLSPSTRDALATKVIAWRDQLGDEVSRWAMRRPLDRQATTQTTSGVRGHEREIAPEPPVVPITDAHVPSVPSASPVPARP